MYYNHDPNSQSALAKMRIQALIKEADTHRMLRNAEFARSGFHYRILDRLGDFLIYVGTRIQRAHKMPHRSLTISR